VGRVELSITLLLDHWIHGKPPSAWLVPLGSARLRRGNLVTIDGDIAGPHHSSISNLRLEGNYTWHVIRRDQDCFALVDPGGAFLDQKLVRYDFEALQGVLGAPLRAEVFSGLAAAGNVTCWAAPLMGGHLGGGAPAVPPVPESLGPECWEPVFFEAVAKTMSTTDPVPLFMALGGYLDSVSEYPVQLSYLRLQVTLEALCRYEEPDMPSLIRNKASWRDWCKSQRAAIEDQATTDPGAAQRLFAHVRQAPQQRPEGDAVAKHLSSLGLSISDELLDEVREGRNEVVHRLRMSGDSEDWNVERIADRIAMIRTLVLAVLAKRVQYGGPIVGWDGHDRFGSPKWWVPAADTAAARRRYVCSRPASTGLTS
jgi:hypothetical protein